MHQSVQFPKSTKGLRDYGNSIGYTVLLALLILFLVNQHVLFFLQYDERVADHEYYHTGHGAVTAYHNLVEGDWAGWFKGLFVYEGYRQPQFIGRIMGLTAYAFGLNRFVLRLVNLAFFVLLAWAVYLTGRTIWNRRVGFLAAFMTVSLPLMIDHSRRGELHFFAASLMMCSLVFLFKADRFRNRSNSLLFGITFGLTLHTHEAIFLQLGALFLYLFFADFVTGDRRRKTNFALSFLVITIFFLPFYMLAYLFPEGHKTFQPAVQSGDGSLLHYLGFHWMELREGFGAVNLLVFLLALLIFLRSRFKAIGQTRENYALGLFLSLFVPLFFVIAVGHRFLVELDTLQYLLPSYPAACLFAVHMLGDSSVIKRRAWTTGERYGLTRLAPLARLAPIAIIMILFLANFRIWGFIGLDLVGAQVENRPQPAYYHHTLIYLTPDEVGAKKVRNYFKKQFANQHAVVYLFGRDRKRAVNRGYFDDLLLHGILAPGPPGPTGHPCYTDRRCYQDFPELCKNTIFMIFHYKSFQDTSPFEMEGGPVPVRHAERAEVEDLCRTYRCERLKVFKGKDRKNPEAPARVHIVVVRGRLQVDDGGA